MSTQHLELLRSLSIILNCYQDIEDQLEKQNPDLVEIRASNNTIGKEVVKHLPE